MGVVASDRIDLAVVVVVEIPDRLDSEELTDDPTSRRPKGGPRPWLTDSTVESRSSELATDPWSHPMGRTLKTACVFSVALVPIVDGVPGHSGVTSL